jgi:hypothetical protein
MSQVKPKSPTFDPDLFNAVNPITGLVVYPKGNVEVLRTCLRQDKATVARREKIRLFSKKSRERLALVAKETDVEFLSMITLTYGVNFPHCGKTVKNHLHKWLGKMTSHFGKFEYLWFFEFQKRGAPHMHVISTLQPPTEQDRAIMSIIWADDVQNLETWFYTRLKDKQKLSDLDAVIWFHRRPRQWEKIRERDGVAKYCTKYALKMWQKVPPAWFGDVGRFWGHSAGVSDFEGCQVKATDDTVRRLLASACPRVKDMDVLPKYIFDCNF